MTYCANNEMVSGEFVTLSNERFYAIKNADQMAPFFMSMISDSDHWLFVSSTGGLTAGRVSPETALFPYVTVDRIHESTSHTGSKTIIQIKEDGKVENWEPFNSEHDGRYNTTRNLYKNLLGNKICFEEINHDLALSFRYTWMSSDKFGFVRQCELKNLSNNSVSLDLLDGLQNLLPAGTPRFTQTNSSNLVDAYKLTELDDHTGLALFTLYSGITDRAEPCESLKTNTVFSLGLDLSTILLSSEQIKGFRKGESPIQETQKRGIRGAYLLNQSMTLDGGAEKSWQIIANLEQTQTQVTQLQEDLRDGQALLDEIMTDVDAGSDALARIMASADGFQATDEENVSVHHYANVLFNVLRGGVFDEQYQISTSDFSNTVKMFNRDVYLRQSEFLENLDDKIDVNALINIVSQQKDKQLERLCLEYLPITFGRRHGDPSRPWNQFAIKLKDENGQRLLSYQGNWRDIFQNWEALTFSYPEFIENVVAKFVNASTMDGYNPYRITKEGIDWEVEEPDDPWSYIGYWGDHQIIYLLKMLELSRQFHPTKLSQLLHQPLFCYANVPYRIKGFKDIVKNAKSTVLYDELAAEKIEHRVSTMGADGKLVLDAKGDVYQVNLLEKLLVPLLCKLGNLVIDGGIWLNTQRPEWNDANNALVGQGLSMVTLYYTRRYMAFMVDLLSDEQTSGTVTLSSEVALWLKETASILKNIQPHLGKGPIDAKLRFETTEQFGQTSSKYREAVYKQESFSGKVSQPISTILHLLEDGLAAIDHTIVNNIANDGLFHAYNLIGLDNSEVSVANLYPMLEGQVAALSSGVVSPEQAAIVLENLFNSEVYREDQHTFMLYPDKVPTRFLDKNRVSADAIKNIALIEHMLSNNDERIMSKDINGDYRFNADITNSDGLKESLDLLTSSYGSELEDAKKPLLALYEEIFTHKEFTGRSGGMFGFEGLGCIYWHMVAKLLLAVSENFFKAVDQKADPKVINKLGELYYKVRYGLGFNKTPLEYGAFPTDPYSHTPKHAGAQQPGMTGQVKEEVLSRFSELGLRVDKGTVKFQTSLLRQCEFAHKQHTLRYLDVSENWQEIVVPEASLAYTWCQVPIIYTLKRSAECALSVTMADGTKQDMPALLIPESICSELFKRTGKVSLIELTITPETLFQK
jgi:hypothetical protein